MAEKSSERTAPTLYQPATGYAFTDELWRPQTARPQLLFVEEPDGRRRPVYPPDYSHHDFPRTAAERAAAKNLELWATSSSPEEYEKRKRSRDKKNRAELEAAVQPTFPKFQSLPPELRLAVWELALQEPRVVTISASTRWRPSREADVLRARAVDHPLHPAEPERPVPPVGRTLLPPVTDFFATAFIPPLMLVNWESHTIASSHYKRAFTNWAGKGGVLAAYPTELRVEDRAFPALMRGTPDIDVVRDLVMEDRGVFALEDREHYTWLKHFDWLKYRLVEEPQST
ncbi:hypothetical protein F5Y14DRAFT_446672 [Nemania sp. NC0429]|nr:hypothetical protein F5Y14DRAFT_446672 [Nemania sp. NC0429]